MSLGKVVCFFCFLVVLVPASAAADVSRDLIGETVTGQVTRFVDGDTVWMRGVPVRVRIWALDAPEIGEPGGDAATRALRDLVGDAPLRCLVRDIDRFGRIVGQCFLPDMRDITAAMIESGTATEFCFFSRNFYGTCR